MKNFFILFLFFFTFFNGFTNEVIKYNGNRLNISKKVFILEDETKNIKEEDIAKGLYDDKFKINKDNLLYLRNNNAIYYIKLDVLNLSSKDVLNLYGWFGPLTLARSEIKCFYLKDSKIIESKFMRKISIKDRRNLLNYGHASFDILPNQTKTIYIRTKYLFATPLLLTEIENIIENERAYTKIVYLLYGVSILLILSILFFYNSLRKKYLIYYILIFSFTYFKSDLFFKFLINYISYSLSNKIYAIAFALYIFFLVHFVIDILRLNKGIENIKGRSYLNFIKCISIVLVGAYLLNAIDISFLLQNIKYIYIIIFTLILYIATKKPKDIWIYKAFLFSWIPNWCLYIYSIFIDQFKWKVILFDVRIYEIMEIFANLFLVAGVLIYNEKELLKKHKVEDQEEFIKIINGADNLMHGLLTLIHSYKKDINFDRVMFFRRKIDRENEEVLYYDFSVPLTLSERAEEKKYFDLAKHLRKDTFSTYYICEDIESNELYKSFLPEYKSLIALRLKFVEGGDLGYIVILNKNKVEYEYNEVMKDFRYKSSLLVQHFKTIDDIREKYGSIIVEETLRNFHIEVLRDAERDVSSTLDQLEKIKTISGKYVVSNDPNVKRVLNLFYDNLEKLMVSIKKDLTFDNPAKKTKNKISFNYSIIEEMLNYLKDITRKTSNKVNINIINQIDSDYELYGHIKVIRSIINHFLSYMYDRIIKHNIESTITITTSLEEGKLKIDTKIEGLVISLEDLRKEYNNEVHKVLLNSTRSKLELKSDDNALHIIYLLNLLTKDEKKKFNIKHLHYDEDYEVDDITNHN